MVPFGGPGMNSFPLLLRQERLKSVKFYCKYKYIYSTAHKETLPELKGTRTGSQTRPDDRDPSKFGSMNWLAWAIVGGLSNVNKVREVDWFLPKDPGS